MTHTTTGPASAPDQALDPARERLRRWRLVLGGDQADGTGCTLSGRDAAMDGTLAALYGRSDRAQSGRDRSAGLGASAPSVARWLGDIRGYFPSSVVQVMQRDAIDRLGLASLLLEPEMLEAVEADVHLVGTLLSLHKAMPDTTKETARARSCARWSRTWRSGSRPVPGRPSPAPWTAARACSDPATTTSTGTGPSRPT
ncbi:hypothetical protein GCM10017687_71700 [Streptomyces echinatus]